jgi:hypothetical protein
MSYLSSKTSNLDPVINYISNGRAYNSTEGWTTYAESDAVTFQNTGDTVTLNSHGLSNGNQISFTAVGTSGLTANLLYYVISATTNTFQVATSLGGSAVAITADSSGTLVRSTPKLGVGGSPSTTFTRNTSSPLRQGADFRFAKDAANRMGQGVAYDFTIDDADLAKVLTLSFDYELVTATGTYANADLVIYLIQDPTGTPVVIQPAGYTVLSAASGLPVKQIATFQTSNSVKSYRLCVHVASVSATAYTLAIDNVVVGPQVVQYGAPVTDWQDYTPTITASVTNPTIGNSTLAGKWRRVGDSMQVQITWILGSTGASGSGAFNFSLPSGFSFDANKVSGPTTSAQNVLGQAFRNDTGTAFYTGNIYYQAANSVRVISAGDWSATFPHTFQTGDSMALEFVAPIQGWSSTVQMSNDTDTRVVAEVYNNNPGQSVTANVTNVIFSNKINSTHGAWNGSIFTAPVPGFYHFDVATRLAAGTSHGLDLFVDGVVKVRLGVSISAYNQGSSVVYLDAGQQASIRISANATIFTSGTWEHNIAIHRLSGPSAIAASETVAARYGTSAGPTVNTSSPIITYGTKSYDTHGAMSGNTFTVPVAGVYRISVSAYANSVAWTSAGLFLTEAVQNGSLVGSIGLHRTSAAVTTGIGAYGSIATRCVAGDTLQIRVYASATTTLSANVNDNFVCIEKVGN